jgi:TPR repeat protein
MNLLRYNIFLSLESLEMKKTQTGKTQTGNSVEKEFLIGLQLLKNVKYKESQIQFEKCTKQNYPPSFVLLGYLYSIGGYLGPRNDNKKSYWFDLSRKYSSWFQDQTTDPNFLCCSGLFFYYVETDIKRAFDLFKLSADLGNELGQFFFGRCFEWGSGVAKDFEKAVKYYQMSADQGNAWGQNNLGVCFENGTGVTKNLETAVKYYQLSADQGNASGQNNYALCLEYGAGIPKDVQKAFKYYQMSADQGNSLGQYYLGVCFENGKGVPKDLEKAVKYYQMSAPYNNDAKQKLEGLRGG